MSAVTTSKANKDKPDIHKSVFIHHQSFNEFCSLDE